jgi:UDP-3-O-[3-hydroxymyristoyl] glucosamine N-acyltransferase
MEKIAFLGGNGLAIELYEYMKRDGIEIYGYYSPEPDSLSEWVDYLGDERIKFDPELSYVVASGLISTRMKMIDFIRMNKLKPYTFISKLASVSGIAKIGAGAQISPTAVISGNPNIGEFVFMNSCSLIAHQSNIGENVVVGPGAKITGNCTIGNNVALGSNVALIPGTKIEDNAEISIGAIPKRLVKSGRFVKAPSSEVIDMGFVRESLFNDGK